ncbi:MAG: TIGR01459 family HAD-type hydrolase [Hyphomicrobiales bacterium]|nr:TIGR01459 family HAD-type hydrolase [Alphaproteobacteria bacterium]
MTAVPFTPNFSTLAGGYDAVLSDVWGVVHNGVVATPAACDALTRFRAQGGTVVLITNAPRPGEVVTHFLDKLQVPRSAYDGIVSSGDVTRSVMASRPQKAVFHIGPERDLPIFDGLGLRFVSLADADYVVCTGLRDDDTETAETFRPELEAMRARNLFMLCGNPDLVVERGDRLIHCAGAIADLYGTMGGTVAYAGKPHAPIYDLTLKRVADIRGNAPAKRRVLAIGDSVRTDVKGATDYGLDCLFVTAGIHAEELGDRHDPDLAALNKMFADAGVAPKAVTNKLMW